MKGKNEMKKKSKKNESTNRAATLCVQGVNKFFQVLV